MAKKQIPKGLLKYVSESIHNYFAEVELRSFYLFSTHIEGSHIIAENERNGKKYRIDITQLE